MNFIEQLQDFVLSLPSSIQFLGVVVAAMVPFVENYGAVVIGSVAGIPVWVTVPLAILGNMAIIVVLTLATSKTRSVVTRSKSDSTVAVLDRDDPDHQAMDQAGDGAEQSASKQKVRKLFDRYGVPGVTMFGLALVPSHVIAPALVGFGSPKGYVLLWQLIGITFYAVATGVLMSGIFSLAGN